MQTKLPDRAAGSAVASTAPWRAGACGHQGPSLLLPAQPGRMVQPGHEFHGGGIAAGIAATWANALILFDRFSASVLILAYLHFRKGGPLPPQLHHIALS